MEIKTIPNQIITEKLQPLNLKKVDSIALHHMDSNADVKEIERIHIAKGWRAIGYNFWVGFDGTIYRGRGLNLGAGVENQNGHIISIGFQGDYHAKPVTMPDKQFNSGIDIIEYVKREVPSVRNVAGHKDFMATACPGKYFPLEEMKRGIRRMETIKMIYNYIDENMPEWAREAVQWAVDNKVVRGTETGLNLDDQDLQTLVWIHRTYLLK